MKTIAYLLSTILAFAWFGASAQDAGKKKLEQDFEKYKAEREFDFQKFKKQREEEMQKMQQEYQDYYNSSPWIWYSGLSIGNQIPRDVLFDLTVTCEPISTYQTRFSVYINNNLMSQASFTWSSRLLSPRQIFSRISGTGLGTRYYLGNIKSVQIYSRALSGSEIGAY